MNAVIRAKMRVVAVSRNIGNDGNVECEIVKLNVVSGPDESDRQWSQYTPCGGMDLTITNPDAYGKLLRGMSFYVDLIPADGKEK